MPTNAESTTSSKISSIGSIARHSGSHSRTLLVQERQAQAVLVRAARGSGRTAPRWGRSASEVALGELVQRRPSRPSSASQRPPSCARNSASVISPRSSSNSGCTPSCVEAVRQRLRRAPRAGSRVLACTRAKASQQRRRQHAAEVGDDRLDRLMRGAARRSGRRRSRPSMRQRKNAQSSRSRPRSSVVPQSDLAGGAARVVVVLADPQLEPGAPLAARRRRRSSRAADRRPRRSPRRAEHARPTRLVGVAGRAGGAHAR